MRDEGFSCVQPLRPLLLAIAFLLCTGLLLSFLADSSSSAVAPLPRNVLDSLEISPAKPSDDLLHASMRRVPKGPDPIHNRYKLLQCSESYLFFFYGGDL